MPTPPQMTIDLSHENAQPDRLNNFVLQKRGLCNKCKCTEKISSVGDACLALGSPLGIDKTWESAAPSCKAFMRDCIGAEPCSEGDKATNKECLEGKRDATSLECQQAKWSCAAPFRKPVSTCTPLLKEVGQICKQLNEVQRESKAHKPSCDTFYKVCEKKPVAAGKSLSVSFGWAWAWVLPTPGSYGWSNAVHYKSVDFTAAVKALESQPIAAVVTKLQELGMKEEEARNAAPNVKKGDISAQIIKMGKDKGVLDVGYTMRAHFCDQRPWGIEAIGCSNDMKLFGWLDRAICESDKGKDIFPPPKQLNRKYRYANPGGWGPSCCSADSKDKKCTEWRDDAAWPSASDKSGFLQLMSGGYLRGSDAGKTDVAFLEESSHSMALTSTGVATEGVLQDAMVRAATNMLIGYLKEGKFQREICIGERANCDAQDYYKSIYGVATLSSSSTAGRVGAKVVASVKKVTLGALAYVGSNSIKKGSGKTVLKVMGPVGRIGMKEVELTLNVYKTKGGASTIELSLKGSPYLGDLSCKNVFTCALKKVANNVVLMQQVQYTPGALTLTSSFGIKPIELVKNKIWLQDSKGIGPSFFVAQQFSKFSKTTVGIQLGVKICVENCKTNTQRHLFFEGELSTTSAATGLDVNGGIRMIGTWDNVMGAPFLHISDVIGRLSISMSQYPPLPSAIEVGGTVCLGSKSACVHGTSTRLIKGLAYGGIAAKDVTRNYVS